MNIALIRSMKYQLSKGRTMAKFARENRYVVFKATDLQAVGLTEAELNFLKAINSKVDQYRIESGKPDFQCVVVEKDWPEYEPTWKAIENRVNTTRELSD
jgi:hypothetical protein